MSLIPQISSITAEQSTKFSKNCSCLDCQQHCCRFICQINSKQLIARSFVDKPLAESHSSCYNKEFMCCSEWLKCLSMSYTEFFSSARLNFYICHYLSHRQHGWSQQFQCFGDLNLNQRRREQDPGIGGPVGCLRTVFIKFEIILFQLANWIQKHSGKIPGNIFEDYMEAQDQIQRNFK